MQEEAFLSGEGNAYHRRNQVVLPSRQQWLALLSDVWDRIPLPEGKRILEIGCGSGENLAFLSRKYGVDCYGLEPSREAVKEGSIQFPGLKLAVGTASKLPYEDGAFDCLLFGCCLYLCDRSALFSIAAEADRVLRPGGALLILDFSPPFPYRNTYKHRPGLYSYKMRYSAMFTWNPAYTVIETRQFSHSDAVFHPEPDERVELAALYKSDPVACYFTDPFAVGDKR
jgi:ubiquinone/menaquinone biosynthesis C-methylase UbiE